MPRLLVAKEQTFIRRRPSPSIADEKQPHGLAPVAGDLPHTANQHMMGVQALRTGEFLRLRGPGKRLFGATSGLVRALETLCRWSKQRMFVFWVFMRHHPR
jgi:hypothetical protein